VLCGFVLIKSFGVWATLGATAGVNLLVGGTFLWLARRMGPTKIEAAAPVPVPNAAPAALPPQNSRHWFAFCTHGNVIGNFFPSVGSQLGARGAKVIGYHNSYADITNSFYPRPSYTSGHPDAEDLERAGRFGALMVVESARRVPLVDRPPGDCL
jgi:hypothetical protein